MLFYLLDEELFDLFLAALFFFFLSFFLSFLLDDDFLFFTFLGDFSFLYFLTRLFLPELFDFDDFDDFEEELEEWEWEQLDLLFFSLIIIIFLDSLFEEELSDLTTLIL